MAESRVCVKVGDLRKLYDKDYNFEKWLEDSENVYCGRVGRIFVNKVYFKYDGSEWANPFTVKKYGLDKSIEMYKEYITEKIKEDSIMFDLSKLKGKKLGCWCNAKDKCHVDILMEIMKL